KVPSFDEGEEYARPDYSTCDGDDYDDDDEGNDAATTTTTTTSLTRLQNGASAATPRRRRRRVDDRAITLPSPASTTLSSPTATACC
ncbi:MAG: hypothetical protein AAFX50_06310, partial [Acidobacteriota bacterium]